MEIVLFGLNHRTAPVEVIVRVSFTTEQARCAALQSPDVVVSSVSAEEPVLRREIVERSMAARGNRALFLMDLGVPRNIDPNVGELYNVYVYNTDDLSQIVQQNRNARESEVPQAKATVDDHGTKCLSWQPSVEL